MTQAQYNDMIGIYSGVAGILAVFGLVGFVLYVVEEATGPWHD